MAITANQDDEADADVDQSGGERKLTKIAQVSQHIHGHVASLANPAVRIAEFGRG
jgi:hypothetical protein